MYLSLLLRDEAQYPDGAHRAVTQFKQFKNLVGFSYVISLDVSCSVASQLFQIDVVSISM
jgi:hypothetical protein